MECDSLNTIEISKINEVEKLQAMEATWDSLIHKDFPFALSLSKGEQKILQH